MKLLKQLVHKDDQEWIEEFYEFLQGNPPASIQCESQPKLTQEQAFNVIWYLQEHFPIIPDHYERCGVCGDIYNEHEEGAWSDVTGQGYCFDCLPLMPEFTNIQE